MLSAANGQLIHPVRVHDLRGVEIRHRTILAWEPRVDDLAAEAKSLKLVDSFCVRAYVYRLRIGVIYVELQAICAVAQAELASTVGTVARAPPGEERGELRRVVHVPVGGLTVDGSAGRETSRAAIGEGFIRHFEGCGFVSVIAIEQVIHRLSSGYRCDAIGVRRATVNWCSCGASPRSEEILPVIADQGWGYLRDVGGVRAARFILPG